MIYVFIAVWYVTTGWAIKRLLEWYKVEAPIKFTPFQSVLLIIVWPMLTFLFYLLIVVVDDAVKDAFKGD